LGPIQAVFHWFRNEDCSRPESFSFYLRREYQ
jgi:hypothetical protein